MRKIGLTLTAAVVLAVSGASAAQASEPVTVSTGPCALQQSLFEKYNIQIDMYAPAVGWAYGQVCGVTG